LATTVARNLTSDAVLQVLTEQWRRHYNAEPPYGARGGQPPSLPAILPSRSGPAQVDPWHVQPAVPNHGPTLP
jgi:transposase InsO family protein